MKKKNLNDELAVFIISHGRADRVATWNTLKRQGFTGRIVVVIDNLDKTSEKYFEKFGRENVVVFDKPAIAKTFDIGDNFENYISTSYARNAAFDIAESLGIKYFLVLDDDYIRFDFRFNSSLDYYQTGQAVRSLDRVFGIILDFFKSCPRVSSIALSQGGDFIGGADGTHASQVKLMRKCMNSWFCSTERRFQFLSRMNEDVNTYIRHGSSGILFFTTNHVSLSQMATQSNSGGMTDIYKSLGTYVKSFYSVMYMPSCAKVSMLNSSNPRLHHKVKGDNTYPKILPEKFRKAGVK